MHFTVVIFSLQPLDFLALWIKTLDFSTRGWGGGGGFQYTVHSVHGVHKIILIIKNHDESSYLPLDF
jgi:hypothetical protein